MENGFEMIGLVDEQELKSLVGAAEVDARTTWPCATYTSTVALTIYVFSDSVRSCPTSACSTRC